MRDLKNQEKETEKRTIVYATTATIYHLMIVIPAMMRFKHHLFGIRCFMDLLPTQNGPVWGDTYNDNPTARPFGVIIPGYFLNLHSLALYKLVGGLEHFFFHVLGISSSRLTFIFFRGVETTNQ